MEFEWNEEKARTNVVTHDVTFDEAKTVFDDRLLVDFFDPNHSDDEPRYLIIGRSNAYRLLVVCIQSDWARRGLSAHGKRPDTNAVIMRKEYKPKWKKKCSRNMI